MSVRPERRRATRRSAPDGREGPVIPRRILLAVDASPLFERLAEVPLNIVCLRCNPGDMDEPSLDRLNQRLGEALLADGRVFAGTTRYAGRVALRPAIVNWRTGEGDIDLFVTVLHELAERLIAEERAG